MRGKNEKGFTLVELLVAMAIAGVLLAGVYTAFTKQRQTYSTQDQVSYAQQNLRAAMHILATEIRQAGYDPNNVTIFGLEDIGFRDLNNFADPQGFSSLSFEIDQDEDGVVDAGETFTYSLFDFGANGVNDLARAVGGGGQQLLAENIRAVGFAYAYDNNGDGQLDTDGGGNIIWAIDTDNNDSLDMELDANSDGLINATDDVNGDGLIDTFDGAANVGPIDADRIRAIRVWMLGQSHKQEPGFSDTDTYVVGRQVMSRALPVGNVNLLADGFRYRLATAIIHCRNLGL